MDFLNRLVQVLQSTSQRMPGGDAIRETASLPVEAVKALNRGTPWGQSNQQNYNAMRVPPQGPGVSNGQVQRAAVNGGFQPGSQVPGMQMGGYPQIGLLQAMSSGQMQPYGQGYEDDYTPLAALEQTGYINPQTSRNGMFQQNGGMPMQGMINPMNYAQYKGTPNKNLRVR